MCNCNDNFFVIHHFQKYLQITAVCINEKIQKQTFLKVKKVDKFSSFSLLSSLGILLKAYLHVKVNVAW